MIEEWRPVPGWEGVYEASSFGRIRTMDRVVRTAKGVRRRKSMILKTEKPANNGYLTFVAYFEGRRSTYTVHRLICRIFHGEPEHDNLQAAHIDGNKLNCRADNLRWSTRAENEADKIEHGSSNRGTSNGQAKLTVQQVLFIRGQPSATVAELSRRLGVSRGAVDGVRTGRTWRHLG